MDPVGSLVGWIVVYGAGGLFLIGLAERFVPVIPSHALLIAIGTAAAEGSLPLPTAFLAISLGGVLGCAACFLSLGAIGEVRATRFARGTGRLFGMSADQVERRIASLRRNGTVLAFSLQLVPTARFLAPAFAALLQGNARSFLAASAAGIAVWNGLFIWVGYAASRAIGATNATVLAVTIIACLLSLQASLFWIVRRIQALRDLEPAPHEGF